MGMGKLNKKKKKKQNQNSSRIPKVIFEKLGKKKKKKKEKLTHQKNSKSWITFCSASLLRHCFLRPKALHVSKHHANSQKDSWHSYRCMYFQRGAAKGVLDESAPLTGPAAPRSFKIRKLPPVFFFGVGIASTCRNKCKFSLHNFCWAGNAYFSTQTVFTTIFFSP